MTTTDKGWQYVPGTRIRHIKRGSTYTIVGPVGIQAPGHCPLTDEETVVLYQGDDGKFWARRPDDLADGRFEVLAAAPKPEPSADMVERANEKAGEWSELSTSARRDLASQFIAFAQEIAGEAMDKINKQHLQIMELSERLSDDVGHWKARAEAAEKALTEAVEAEREACARLVEGYGFYQADFGEPAPGKTFSGITTIDNRRGNEPELAVAIRARKGASNGQ